jgi:hypothetical protein
LPGPLVAAAADLRVRLPNRHGKTADQQV